MTGRLVGVRGLRGALRAGAVVFAAALALPLMSTGAGAQVDALGARLVQGRWNTTVLPNGKPPSEVVLVFRRDHRIEMYGPIGTDGEPVYVGTGSWVRTSPRTFSFDLQHPLPDGSGGVIGTLRGHQEGQLSAFRFSSSGESFVDKPDGTTVGPNPVTMTGVRARR
ncbi:hypothetical protein [Saccharothrix sp. HUAS TT1]|uniref:hypothetical protein n=1 Tax=unclassified Saccharothrix TaxID=2593673 RepID=UPI00345C0992